MISIEKDKYKLLKKIKDPKFNIDKLEHYNLSLQLGIRDFQVFIFDTLERRALLLEDYIFNQEVNSHSILEIIKDIVDNHHLLAAGFWKSVTIIFKNKKFVMVPEGFFGKEHAASFLKLNHGLTSNDNVFSIHHKDSFVSVFAAEKIYCDYFKALYPNTRVKFLHQSSPIINGTIRRGGNYFLMYIDRFNLHLSVLRNSQLFYYNQFPIKKMEDFTRYFRLVTSDLQIDPAQFNIEVYGFLGKNTPQYNYLKQHIPQIALGSKTNRMKFGYVFDEIADHQFFDVFSLY